MKNRFLGFSSVFRFLSIRRHFFRRRRRSVNVLLFVGGVSPSKNPGLEAAAPLKSRRAATIVVVNSSMIHGDWGKCEVVRAPKIEFVLPRRNVNGAK